MGQVIVEFDPYVSILDKTNRSRYNVEDLQVLLSKVATRFPKIYIEFTDADLELQGYFYFVHLNLSDVILIEYLMCFQTQVFLNHHL